jgi:hypothetical protein
VVTDIVHFQQHSHELGRYLATFKLTTDFGPGLEKSGRILRKHVAQKESRQHQRLVRHHGISVFKAVTENTENWENASRAFSAFRNRNVVFHRQFRNLTVALQLQFRNRNFFCIPPLYQTKFSFMPVRTFCIPPLYQTKFSFMPVRTFSSLNCFHWNHHICLHFLSVPYKNWAQRDPNFLHDIENSFSLLQPIPLPHGPTYLVAETSPLEATVFAVFYGALLLSFEVWERQLLIDSLLNFIHDWSRGGFQ